MTTDGLSPTSLSPAMSLLWESLPLNLSTCSDRRHQPKGEKGMCIVAVYMDLSDAGRLVS